MACVRDDKEAGIGIGMTCSHWIVQSILADSFKLNSPVIDIAHLENKTVAFRSKCPKNSGPASLQTSELLECISRLVCAGRLCGRRIGAISHHGFHHHVNFSPAFLDLARDEFVGVVGQFCHQIKSPVDRLGTNLLNRPAMVMMQS